MTDFLAALALVFVLEGLAYAAFPEQMKKAIQSLLTAPNSTIRVVALAGAGGGLVMLYFIRAG